MTYMHSAVTYTAIDGTEYAVMQSSSKMPRNCWGRYAHSAVLCVVPGGRTPKYIRDTRDAKVIWDSGPGFSGSSARCQADKDYAYAIARAVACCTRRDDTIRAGMTSGYLASLAERSGECAA